ncbi:nitroreductase family protein [Robertkochia sediminum]|uniref:nitroreductase family protein n=1 Tax=Robertkochia sediminum TaxID=2785326 RepID=UPI001934810E|nr:nitroreductase family protein [Robertkochia sediminum]MBL7473375.1 nitroreductase family protein [Robertkochia sediminum]
MEKTVSEAIQYRRSVRVFKDDENPDPEVVRSCIEEATLAPTSSNLQLWEFYHIVSEDTLEKMTEACLGQNAAKTAKQMVVVVSRKDLYKKRAQQNINFLKSVYGDKPESEYSRREKFALNYYKKLIPTIYTDFLGILGQLKYMVFNVIGLFRPVYRQVRRSDMRIVAQKSAGLAAQTFMLSMAAKGYDTCPMEGSDTLRVKKLLGIPSSAEINMVIGCGVRAENGIYGPRFRVPFEETYKRV